MYVCKHVCIYTRDTLVYMACMRLKCAKLTQGCVVCDKGMQCMGVAFRGAAIQVGAHGCRYGQLWDGREPVSSPRQQSTCSFQS